MLLLSVYKAKAQDIGNICKKSDAAECAIYDQGTHRLLTDNSNQTELIYLLLCNYQLSKSIVNEIKFGDIAVM